MECKNCKSSINNGAVKCPHCMSYQTFTGILSPKIQAVAILSFLSILAIPLKIIADSHFQEKYSELDRQARFLVLEDNAGRSTEGDIQYSDEDVSVFNYWSLKSRVDEITSIMSQKPMQDAIYCLNSKGKYCGDLNTQVSLDSLIINFEETPQKIARRYLMNMAVAIDVDLISASKDKITVHYTTN